MEQTLCTAVPGTLPAILKRLLARQLPGPDSWQRMMPSLRLPLPHPISSAPPVESAVLLMLYHDAGDFRLVFMQRPEYSGPHSGQVSFPGGKYEQQDKDLIETALRESEEETGIDRAAVDVLGTLSPLFIPASNHRVLPVVGYHRGIPQFMPNPLEVKAIIILPVSHFFDGQNEDTLDFQVKDIRINAPCFTTGSTPIWGATAMILCELLAVYEKAMRVICTKALNQADCESLPDC